MGTKGESFERANRAVIEATAFGATGVLLMVAGGWATLLVGPGPVVDANPVFLTLRGATELGIVVASYGIIHAAYGVRCWGYPDVFEDISQHWKEDLES